MKSKDKMSLISLSNENLPINLFIEKNQQVFDLTNNENPSSIFLFKDQNSKNHKNVLNRPKIKESPYFGWKANNDAQGTFFIFEINNFG